MAMSRKKGKIEKDLDTVNNSLDSILNQYKPIAKKDKKSIIKNLKKKKNKALKNWQKSASGVDYFKMQSIDAKIDKVENDSGKIPINYGIFDFNIDADYLKRIKDKEQYLDGLFHRKMKSLLEKTEAPKTKYEATALEGLITQYSKKIKDSKFYDPTLVENNINKLTSFRNRIMSDYDYSDFIMNKKNVIEKEVIDYENGDEIGDYYEQETGEQEEIYKAIEKPILIDDLLVGIQFNFF